MDAILTHASALSGTLALPADKAICHRAALVCALADGPTELAPWSTAEDCQRTLELVKALGVPVTGTSQGIRIQGVGLDGLRRAAGPMECGESGTTMRLAAGLLAGQPFESVLNASGSLRQRPMKRMIEPLRQMGAKIEGRLQDGETYPPLTISKRPLKAITYRMPVASAQVKSAILLAGLFADGRTEIREPVGTRDHTERLLNRLGAPIRTIGTTVALGGGVANLQSPGQLSIPADPSSAAFFVVAALLVPASEITLPNVGLNPSRIHFLQVLRRMGALVEWQIEGEAWEPRGTLIAKSSALHGMTVSAAEAAMLIDELPILMVAACAAEGETRFEGLQELAVKESDRLHAMAAGLEAFGARVEVVGSATMTVRHRALHCASVESVGDHRIAMSLAIAGLLAEGETRIRHAECVAKSFPDFFECLASVTGGSSIKTIDSAIW